jgi:cytochrome c553
MIGIVAFIGALALMAAAIAGLSQRPLGRHFAVTPAAISIPTDSASLERGRHLGEAIAKCPDCHGPDLGGVAMEMGPLGTFPAPNLTTGQGGIERSDADWVRAVHHGVASDGRALVFMPSSAYSGLSADDLGAIIAWVKSMPPVDRTLPGRTLGPIGRVILATKPARLVPALAIDHSAPLPAAVPVSATPEYGRYITVVGGCTYCHGDNLAGGIKEGPPGTPPSANLRADGPIASWTEADFRTALRTGKRPDGSAINPFMPWRAAGRMTDEEIAATWAYLRTLK